MLICGMDEVGRGAIAGPLVGAAAVISRQSLVIKKLRDSKKLSRLQRESLLPEINSAFKIEVEIISVGEINEYGIGWANREVFEKLAKRINADKFIADGNLKIPGVDSVVAADGKIAEVMAASIVAKVFRDNLMRELHELFGVYGWDTNVGYGTKKHIDGLIKHGTCEHHRDLFVRTVLKSSVGSKSVGE